MADNPLLDSALVSRQLRAEGISPTAESRDFALRVVLSALVGEQLAHHRANPPLARGRSGKQDSNTGRNGTANGQPNACPPRPIEGFDRECLKADFWANDKAREEWSTLYHHFVLPAPLQQQEIVALANLGYRKLIERRCKSGTAALTRLILEKEQAAIRSGDAAAAEPATEPGRPSKPPSLLKPRSLFFGRERAVAELAELVQNAPLVTVRGTGGVGKTRLALETAPRLMDHFADGVWMVELAGLTNGDQIPEAIESTFAAAGLKVQSGDAPLVERLGQTLNPLHLLLIMDNCETLIGSCAKVIDALLQACPRLHILATSRFLLKVDGETVMNLPPLPVPPPGDALPLGQLTAYPSVQLFLDRAASVQPSFRRHDTDAEAIVAICRRLDGLPLAIRLAAARLSGMSLGELRAGMQDPLEVLGEGHSTDRPDHVAIQETIKASYLLLDPAEQRLFDELSVFSGAFSLSAAQAVCVGPDLTLTAVRDALGRLVTKSMVEFELLANGQGRYFLLELLREFGRKQLGSRHEVSEFEERHARYFVQLAEEADIGIKGAHQAEWLDHLELQHDNLRAALDYTLRRDTVLHSRMVGALWRFWRYRGHLNEGREYTRAGLKVAAGIDDPLLKYRIVNAAGAMAYYQGDLEDALGLFEAGSLLAQQLGLHEVMAMAETNVIVVLNDQGNSQAIRGRQEANLALLRNVGMPRSITVALLNLGQTALDQADYSAARHFLEEALLGCQEIGDAMLEGEALRILGFTFLGLSELERAEASFRESEALLGRLGYENAAAEALRGLGMVYRLRGNYTYARQLQEESIATHRRLDDRWGEADVLYELAELALAQADFDLAEQYCREVISLRQDQVAPDVKRRAVQCLEQIPRLRELGDVAGHTNQHWP